MKELTAQHYLNVWHARLSMAERGVTSPPPPVLEAMRQLVHSFSELPPDTEITVETDGGGVTFIVAESGNALAEYDFTT